MKCNLHTICNAQYIRLVWYCRSHWAHNAKLDATRTANVAPHFPNSVARINQDAIANSEQPSPFPFVESRLVHQKLGRRRPNKMNPLLDIDEFEYLRVCA